MWRRSIQSLATVLVLLTLLVHQASSGGTAHEHLDINNGFESFKTNRRRLDCRRRRRRPHSASVETFTRQRTANINTNLIINSLPPVSTTFDPLVDPPLSTEQLAELHTDNVDRFIERHQLEAMLQIRRVFTQAVQNRDRRTVLALLNACSNPPLPLFKPIIQRAIMHGDKSTLDWIDDIVTGTADNRRNDEPQEQIMALQQLREIYGAAEIDRLPLKDDAGRQLDVHLLAETIRGDSERVRMLLEIGADAGYNGGEPLRKAVEEGHDQVAELLLAHGAGLGHLAGEIDSSRLPLRGAAGRGHSKMTQLLQSYGIAIHSPVGVKMPVNRVD